MNYIKVLSILVLSHSLVAKDSVPYNVPYTVKCYNKAGVRISCDKALRASSKKQKRRKRVKKKYSSEYYRLKRELAKIKRKQRKLERQQQVAKTKKRKDDLRELALQNKKLLEEIKALREAQELAIAKQEEKPNTVVLAPNTAGATVNTPAPEPEPIAKTIVKEEKKDEDKDSDGFSVSTLLETWGSQSMIDADASASLGGDIEFGFKLTDAFSLSVVPAFNIKFATKDEPGSFTLGDTSVNLAHAFYKSGNISMGSRYSIILPTSKSSQDNHQYAAFSAETKLSIGLWKERGSLSFKPALAFSWREYATSVPTNKASATYIEIPTGAKYEKLDPNEKYNVSIETKLSYNLNDFMSTYVKFYVKGQDMYADTVLSGGTIYTITPEQWKTSIAFTFPALGFKLSDHAYLEFSVATKGPAENFSLFEPRDGNDTTISFYFNYSI